MQLFTESQNGCGWKGLMEVTCFNPSAEAGPPEAGSLGPCSDGFAAFGYLFTLIRCPLQVHVLH